MPGHDPVASNAASPRPRGRGVIWALVLAVIVIAGWQAWRAWQALRGAPAGNVAAVTTVAGDDDAPVGDPLLAIRALRREQHDLAQRISDVTAGQQVLRDEVLGVGERAALVEQSVAAIASPRAQGEQALRLDEAELLLTIGQQQIELAADVGGAMRAYALADGVLAGSTDPAVVDLRQPLAQEMAAMRALPPDPRRVLAGRLDAFEASLASAPFADAAEAPAAHPSLVDRVVGSMVEVHRAQARDLLDPASRDAALTALRLELTMARLALAQRDGDAFHAALARMDAWLPRLYGPVLVARQRRLLQDLGSAPVRIVLPTLGGTLAELRRLRLQQPAPVIAAPAATAPVPPARSRQRAPAPDAASR